MRGAIQKSILDTRRAKLDSYGGLVWGSAVPKMADFPDQITESALDLYEVAAYKLSGDGKSLVAIAPEVARKNLEFVAGRKLSDRDWDWIVQGGDMPISIKPTARNKRVLRNAWTRAKAFQKLRRPRARGSSGPRPVKPTYWKMIGTSTKLNAHDTVDLVDSTANYAYIRKALEDSGLDTGIVDSTMSSLRKKVGQGHNSDFKVANALTAWLKGEGKPKRVVKVAIGKLHARAGGERKVTKGSNIYAKLNKEFKYSSKLTSNRKVRQALNSVFTATTVGDNFMIGDFDTKIEKTERGTNSLASVLSGNRGFRNKMKKKLILDQITTGAANFKANTAGLEIDGSEVTWEQKFETLRELHRDLKNINLPEFKKALDVSAADPGGAGKTLLDRFYAKLRKGREVIGNRREMSKAAKSRAWKTFRDRALDEFKREVEGGGVLA